MSKTGMKEADMSKAGAKADAELAKALLKIVAVGVAGGAALIGGAKKVGDRISKK